MRAEQTIFDELLSLCCSPGYVHAIAYFCFRDNMIQYSGEMKTEDMEHLFAKSRLVRTEISTLIGLMLKQEIDYSQPAPPVLQEYLKTTEALLEEIHHAMSAVFLQGLDPAKLVEKNFNPFTSGPALREPIFYGSESAYSFQYCDFSRAKYSSDDHWLIAKKGFSIHDAHKVVSAISRLQNERATTILRSMREIAQDAGTFLPNYTFSAQEVSDRTHIDLAIVERILTAFAVPPGERNEQFAALHDFNIANASPLIRTPDGKYLLLHIYSLVEALYEAPFYWMGADKVYASTAMKNRGLFTEQFAIDRFSQVFGTRNVLSNIDIYESKSKRLTEIDVLVLFGNRALVLQAKSKRLTLEARRGNDRQIKDDFKKSIQDASDQAYQCAQLLEAGKCSFKDAAGNKVTLPAGLKRIYVICLISDHYPALSFQARQFLTYKPTEMISPPLVIDVFALDAMTEMLRSPLQLLSYIDRRTSYIDKLIASHELTILSYHLKENLWLNEDFDRIILDDDIAADLDLAMHVRREGIPGKETPDGILTQIATTTVGRMVKEIEAKPDPATIDLGFMLLTLSEETVLDVSTSIEKIAKQAWIDGKAFSLTVRFGRGNTGLTVHCNDDPIELAKPSLQKHCHKRKYTERAQTWFGVCLRPSDCSLRFGVNLEYDWVQNDEMDALTGSMGKLGKLSTFSKGSSEKRCKVGRNEPCPCGSGKKFKKCCMV